MGSKRLIRLSRAITIIIILVSIGAGYFFQKYDNNIGFKVIKKEELINEKDLKVNSYTILVNRLSSDEELYEKGEDVYYKLSNKYIDLKAFELKFVDSYKNADGPFAKLTYAPGGDINNCYGLTEKESTFNLIRFQD